MDVDGSDDSLFREEDDSDGIGMGRDVFHCMIDRGTENEGMALDWESRISWD